MRGSTVPETWFVGEAQFLQKINVVPSPEVGRNMKYWPAFLYAHYYLWKMAYDQWFSVVKHVEKTLPFKPSSSALTMRISIFKALEVLP